MKNRLELLPVRPWVRVWLVILALAGGLAEARAGLTVEVHLYNNNNYYFAYAWLTANSDGPAFPVGFYTISAPTYPASGTYLQYLSTDGTTLVYQNGGGSAFGDFPSLMASITNGNWTIQVTNTTTTNTYLFTVSAPVFPENVLATAAITYPTNGASNVLSQPDFTWQGPTGWEGSLQVDDVTNDSLGYDYTQAAASLPSGQTSWTPSVTLPNGTNRFYLDYLSNATAIIVASTPLEGATAISSWASTAYLESYTQSQFFVGGGSLPAGGGPTGHTLIAEYPLSQAAIGSGTDVSGNNNGFNSGESWAASGRTEYNPAGIAGGGSLQFDGGEAMTLNSPPGNHSFDNWLATFYGSFSVSLWVNTTTIMGNDTDDFSGNGDAAVIWAYNNGVNDTIPILLTGHKAAFFTGDPTGSFGDTLHSTNDVTTGEFVHIVVTRDQTSGQKAIYINGALDSTDTGTTSPLDGDTNFYSIGGLYWSSYSGLLYDVQIYSGVLNSNEVAFLYNNPGQTATNLAGATSGLVAYYDFDEGTDLAADLTANGNNLVNGGSFTGPVLTNDAISGNGAVYFNGGGFLTPPASLLPTLASNFSLSLWVKTTQSIAWDTAPAYYGAGIVSADVPGTTNDLVPVALTGGAIGFNTGSPSNDYTLNSATDINDGSYHLVVVTRDQATGAKQIYIDGLLNTNDVGAAGLLNTPQLITIGALADASNPDPTSPEYSGHNGFVGLVDDIQIYSRVLSPAEVTALHATPGSVAAGGGLAAHYDFDEGTVLAADVSGNGNNLVFAGILEYNAPGPAITGSAESGPGALSFDGGHYLAPEGNLPSTLASNFSLSVWLQTTQSLGAAGDPAYQGAGIVTALVPGQSFDLAPVALTGGKLAFETDGFSPDTLTSTKTINDGSYHHVVVTRDQGTGTKQIYIDGALDSSDVDDGFLLNSPQIVIFGALADASLGDPHSPSHTGSNGYVGLMDSVQIYSRVISSAEVAFLYANPGETIPVPGSASNPFATTLGTSNVLWSTSGDAVWFAETTNTYSTNAAAMQSGSLQDNQSSILQATVTGPGIISFYWQTTANGDDFDLECDLDGSYENDISGQTSWQPFTFPITNFGTHIVTWSANTLEDYYGSSPTDAGFVDQVVYTPDVAPVITVNPFNQTNYPGYSVALLAAATGTPAPTWQWFSVTNADPIPGATSALFIPTNSGAASVAGGYYAVASNPAGSQTTTTAMVTFVSVPLPPDWTEAFKSPFDNEGSYKANDVFYACLVDSTGTNLFSAGSSTGTNFFFGTNEIINTNGGSAAVIVKQTAAKACDWVVTITNNGNGSAHAQDIAPAPGGGIYAAGSFLGTNWLGNTLLQDTGQGTAFVVRLDAEGNTVWVRTVNAASGSYVPLNILAADAAGNVTFGGIINGPATIGASNLTVSGQTGFLAQFNESGAVNWAEPLSNPVEYLQYSEGTVYASLINWISANSSFTVGGLVNDMALNWTLAAINSTNGQGIWLRDVAEARGEFPGVIDDYPEIAVSGSNVFLVGTAYGSSAVFGAFTVPIADGRGQYFARYDTNGNAQLALGFGSPTTQPEAAVADAAGNVYVAGNFDTYSYFGNEILAAPRINTLGNGFYGQAFAAKFDRTGTAQWARLAESTSNTFEVTDLVNLFDLSLTPTGVWVCGMGSGAAYFGTNLVNSANELFVIGMSLYAQEFNSGMAGMIALPGAQVTLLNPEVAGANFQFQFQSQAGYSHNILYRTDLGAGQWLTNSTVPGDGTVQNISIPLSVFSPAAEGFVEVSTQ